MNRCSRCVMPDTRPDTPFIDGVCSACISFDKRREVDWGKRLEALKRLLERFDGNVIVPSSGGKDSTYQALTLRDMGADVTVVTARTCHLTPIGRANIDNLARYCRTIEFVPNMEQRAKLNRIGMEMVGDISWPEHVAIFTTPFWAAAMTRRKLIMYGENPQNQYGGPLGSEEAMKMTKRWRSEFGGFLGLRPVDVEPLAGSMQEYMLPPEDQVEHVEAHFLGQYIPWDSHRNAEVAVRAGMIAKRPSAANWWDHENLDNAQTGIHDYAMRRKYGYGRGCAQISVDVRLGRIGRGEALAWVEEHDGVFPEFYAGVRIDDVLQRLGVDRRWLMHNLDSFTNPAVHAARA